MTKGILSYFSSFTLIYFTGNLFSQTLCMFRLISSKFEFNFTKFRGIKHCKGFMAVEFRALESVCVSDLDEPNVRYRQYIVVTFLTLYPSPREMAALITARYSETVI